MKGTENKNKFVKRLQTKHVEFIPELQVGSGFGSGSGRVRA